MTTHQLQLRSVHELASERFFVPAYQRGFRWTRQQVQELLNDVWDFVQTGGRTQGQFYCLQPVVVSPREGGDWEVVDGQQRLTTLYLILHRFNQRLQPEDRNQQYGIEYETRPASAEFLQHLDPARAGENIDFSHMTEAYDVIHAWMQEHRNRINDMESAFLNDVKVIWYEVGDENPIEVFQRLNMGKISLTGAELVKALLLRASNFVSEGDKALQIRQLQIAHEWDAMERRLGEDDFWYFLTNAPRESNRIEFILQLYAAQRAVTDPAWAENSVFHAFATHMASEGAKAWSVWEDIKGLFQTVEEWYRDPVLYHLVGFLTTIDKTGAAHRAIDAVNDMARRAPSKQAFRGILKAAIFPRVFNNRSREKAPSGGTELRDFIAGELGELDYSNKITTRATLLLFNIVSLMTSKSKSRFPFEAYNREEWDIEHIRSVQSRMPLQPHAQKKWLKDVLDYLGDEEAQSTADARPIRDEARALAQDAKRLWRAEVHDDAGFREFFSAVQKLYHPLQASDHDVDNSLGNLALLDQRTNRGYGNAIFPLKRKTIIDLDYKGQFIPLCTRNVFLKYYSARVDRMLDWTQDDASAYFNAVVDSLTQFFTQEASA